MKNLTNKLITNKNALIFGVSGQDGSYLAKYLIIKNTKYLAFLEKKKSSSITNYLA